MTRRWACICAILCVFATSSLSAQTTAASLASTLEQKLKGKVLSLRSPSAAKTLHFDSGGLPVGTQEHGVASLDRDILVKSIKVTNDSVRVEGQRIYYSWDPTADKMMASAERIKVAVQIDAPIGNVSEAAIAPTFGKVFLSAQESEKRGCTPAETASSHRFLTDWLYKVSVVPTPPVSKKSDLESICFPTGERGYVVAKGVTPPKAVSTPDPSYSESARRRKIQGTAIYALLIDEQGLVSDALLVRSLEPSLNFNAVVALRKWRFKPATFEGEPIPGAVHVEMNFRLY